MFKLAEHKFLQLVELIQIFGDSVVFVGGWLPYLYTEYVWKSRINDPIFTEDVDLGIRMFHGHDKTLAQCFSEADFILKTKQVDHEFEYYQLIDGDRLYSIDIIAGDPDPGQFVKLTGKKMHVVNSLNNFDLLIQKSNTLLIKIPYAEKQLDLRLPKPGAYLYHKGITFEERSMKEELSYKYKKDLWSVFYMIANVPVSGKDQLMEDVQAFREDSDYPDFIEKLKEFFDTPKSQGTSHVYDFYANEFPPEYKIFISKTVMQFWQKLIQSV